MSTNSRETAVKWIRIQWPDRDTLTMYNSEPAVVIGSDPRTRTMYLRIAANRQAILVEPINKFQWLDKSSSNGIATISSSANKIIISYDFNNRTSRDFFIELRDILENGPPPSPPPESPDRTAPPRANPNTQDQTQSAINDLIEFIKNGSSNDVEHATGYLAKSRANVQFNLISQNDSQEKARPTNIPTKPSSDILKLTLLIECHLNKEPLRSTIYVRSGTELLTLKNQISNDTGIKREDQYWYAFDRYLIADDYIIGSATSVVPLRTKNTPNKQVITTTDPIRSGDTLIMYIAQIPPCK